MNLELEKNKIAKAVLELEDEQTVSSLKEILFPDEETEFDEKWFENLPQSVKDGIALGEKQLRDGKGIDAFEHLAKMRAK